MPLSGSMSTSEVLARALDAAESEPRGGFLQPVGSQVEAEGDADDGQAGVHWSSRRRWRVSSRLSVIMLPSSHGAAWLPVSRCPLATRSPVTLDRLAVSRSFWLIGTSWS